MSGVVGNDVNKTARSLLSHANVHTCFTIHLPMTILDIDLQKHAQRQSEFLRDMEKKHGDLSSVLGSVANKTFPAVVKKTTVTRSSSAANRDQVQSKKDLAHSSSSRLPQAVLSLAEGLAKYEVKPDRNEKVKTSKLVYAHRTQRKKNHSF